MMKRLIYVGLFALFFAGCQFSQDSNEPEEPLTEVVDDDTLVVEEEEKERLIPTDLAGNEPLKRHLTELRNSMERVPNPFVATFTGAELGDYFHLIFEDTKGMSYDFGDADNDFGDVNLLDEDGLAGNPEYVGKQFKVSWEWKLSSFNCCEGGMDVMVAEIPTMTGLELVEK